MTDLINQVYARKATPPVTEGSLSPNWNRRGLKQSGTEGRGIIYIHNIYIYIYIYLSHFFVSNPCDWNRICLRFVM